MNAPLPATSRTKDPAGFRPTGGCAGRPRDRWL